MRETAEPAPQLTAEERLVKLGIATDAECGAALEYFTNGPGVDHPKRNAIWRLIARVWSDRATIDSLRTQLAEAQERETALREALEYIADYGHDQHDKDAAARALSGEQANG